MQIPKHAKKVFTGVIFDVYHWKQKMFNNTTETFEMLKRPDTIEVIPIMGNKIILLNEEQLNIEKSYGVVGGRKDENETPLECAKRELLEETGLKIKNLEYLGVVKDWQKTKHFIHFVYFGKISDHQNPKAREKNKCEIWEWFDLDQIPAKTLIGHKAALEIFQHPNRENLKDV